MCGSSSWRKSLQSFAATTCFRSSVYKLRGSIQSSKKTLSQACQETKTERSLCTLFKAVAALVILFLTAHRAAASSKLVSLHHFKYWKWTNEWASTLCSTLTSNQRWRGQMSHCKTTFPKCIKHSVWTLFYTGSDVLYFSGLFGRSRRRAAKATIIRHSFN